MRKQDAHAIISGYSLPSRETSDRVLKAIIKGKLEQSALPPRHFHRLEKIAAAYKDKVAELGARSYPANLPFYLLISEKYPVFKFQECGGQLRFECFYRGTKPNLLVLLLGLIPPDQLAPSARLSKFAAKSHDSGISRACRETFAAEGVTDNTSLNFMRFLDWIDQGKTGKPLTIISVVCPDYAAEKTETGDFRYTFDALNGGIGLAAKRLYKAMPGLHSLLSDRLGLQNITHRVCVADFEAYSEDNVRRVGITETEFLAALSQQQAALQEHAPREIALCRFCDFCGGKNGWLSELGDMRARFGAGEFSGMLDRQTIRAIAQERRSLYRRWFGKHLMQDQFLDALVSNQATEYATEGKVIADAFPDALILTTGNYKLTQFYAAANSLPVLCLGAQHL